MILYYGFIIFLNFNSNFNYKFVGDGVWDRTPFDF